MEVDEFTAKINERSEMCLVPIVEDLAEWLASYLQLSIKPHNFLELLDNGVILCKLAEKIQKHSSDYIHGKRIDVSHGSKKSKLKSLPPFQYKCHVNAKHGTFFARENAANFIKWCKSLGIQDSTLFESEGLVFRKELKNIVNTLLELGRIGFRYELPVVPSLVKLEHELEEEERGEMSNVTFRKKKSRSNEKDIIDMKVQMFSKQYGVQMKRVKEGKYLVNGKMNIIVRVLRNHFMVRVGGGWDELEHFLSRHNPDRIGKILISSSVQSPSRN